MYGKHFASTYAGSMVGAGLNVFALWGYVIANTVKSRVELNPKLLAMILGCEEQEVRLALDYLTSPDPDSRHKEHEGKRLVKEGQYQYFVPSHETYRKILNEDERREYNRMKQAEHRARKAAEATKKEGCQDVKEQVIDKSAVSAHTDTEADLKEEEKSFNSELTPSVLATLYVTQRQGATGHKSATQKINAAIARGTLAEDVKKAIVAAPLGREIWEILDQFRNKPEPDKPKTDPSDPKREYNRKNFPKDWDENGRHYSEPPSDD